MRLVEIRCDLIKPTSREATMKKNNEPANMNKWIHGCRERHMQLPSSIHHPSMCRRGALSSSPHLGSVNVFISALYYKRRDFGFCLLSGAALRK